MKTAESRFYSTFEAARVCGVFHTTVINWTRQGRLKARRTPGGHRRIAAGDLLEFMRRFGLPIPEGLEGRARRILIADDEPPIQKALRRLFSSLPGVRLRACRNGLEALIWIGKESPDLLLLDLRMPQIDGLRVCRLLKSKEQTSSIKIIAMARAALSHGEERLVKRHASALFYKPFPLKQLRDTVARLLEL